MGSSELTSTQKVRIQKDLEFSEERFRIIVEQTGQLVYDYDVLKDVISWAGAIEAITGYSAEEFKRVGVLEWEEMIHPEDRMRVTERMESSLSTALPFEMEYRFRRKDGAYIHVEDHGIFLKNAKGAARRMLGVMSDITLRVEGQEALRQSEELYRSLAQASSYMIWIVDAAGQTVLDISAWLQYTGLTMEELGNNGWTKSIHPEDFPQMLERWQKSLKSGIIYECEYRLRRRDGIYRLMAARAVPVRDDKGVLQRWIGTCQDITEQRESERRQILLEAQLRQSQKMEAIGTLAGGIAHDFNNILMAIISYGELAEFEAKGQDSQLENIRHILDAAFRARELVKQILAFSRQTRQETRPVLLSTITAEALKILKAALSSQIEIKIECEDELPSILADPTQMQQVILNLCTNSAQALRKQGGQIELYLAGMDFTSPSLAEKHHLHPGYYVLLRVSDNGVGMDAETTKRIFDPFFTTKGPGEGTGLGLSVVHGIVMAHQGVIEVSSKEGEGTSFDLYFPAVFGAEEVPASSEPKIQRGSGQKILIVDDEIKICRSLSRILERLGYWTEFMVRPVQAWELLEKDPKAWDMVITDLTMPGMTGIQLAEKIHKAREDLPVLLVTGYSGSWTQDQLEEKGIVEMMAKPVSTTNLASAVARALRLP